VKKTNAKQGSLLWLIGLGVAVDSHMTVQASKALARCSEIYSIVQESPHLWLPSNAWERAKVVNVLDWYVEGKMRSDNYEYVATSIMAAVTADKEVGYVTYGNPMAYDRVAQNLLARCRQSRIPVRIVPGISSVDTILCDLGFDMAPAIQIFEASWLVACKIRPRIDIALLLMQVGTFGSLRTHYTKRQDGSSLRDLVNHLTAFYPPQHQIYLVCSTASEGQTVRLSDIPLCSLAQVTAEQLSGASLYIPALTDVNPSPTIIRKMMTV
jgi:uncharacterized protein YabN with tetrapyrrole methylase and pyrophosphatase domain